MPVTVSSFELNWNTLLLNINCETITNVDLKVTIQTIGSLLRKINFYL